jgi:NADH:ubiquinone oxidoreductase subunit H
VLFLAGTAGPVLPPLLWLALKSAALSVALVLAGRALDRLPERARARLGPAWLVPVSALNLAATFVVLAG